MLLHSEVFWVSCKSSFALGFRVLRYFFNVSGKAKARVWHTPCFYKAKVPHPAAPPPTSLTHSCAAHLLILPLDNTYAPTTSFSPTQFFLLPCAPPTYITYFHLVELETTPSYVPMRTDVLYFFVQVLIHFRKWG
jgi:hypothetical protein